MLVYTRYPDQDLTIFVLEEATTIDQWVGALDRYGQEGPTTYELYDLRGVTMSLTSEDIQRIVETSKRDRDLRPPNGKTAVVVGDALKFGLARMYELLSEAEGITWETKPFYTIEDASGWLGKDVAALGTNSRPSSAGERPAG